MDGLRFQNTDCFYNPKSVTIENDSITALPSIEGNRDNEQSGTGHLMNLISPIQLFQYLEKILSINGNSGSTN